MPAALHPYLSFPGTTREAFDFYGEALGGTPTFATFGSFGAVPEDHPAADLIMHASLEVDDLIKLYAADWVEGMTPHPHIVGNNISLALMGDDEPLIRGAFEALAVGGEIVMPLELQVWGDRYGALTDRFGIIWQVDIGAGDEG